MPAIATWASSAYQTRLPPTPPEYQGAYLTPMSAMSDQSFYPSQTYLPRPQSGRDFIDRYSHASAYPVHQAPVAKQHNRVSQMMVPQAYQDPSAYATQVHSQYPYAGAPVLPPLRVPEPIEYHPAPYVPAHPEPKPKEEKATGGVAAHLDYDMDLMSAFVAEMSQRLVSPGTSPTAQFRKYVSQILSSTRLPSSTIMLAMFYLASRMKILRDRGEEVQSSATVYRMLTICLLLGSKFLDDNTFQNRSWAEVSSISVQDLNFMELQWLKDFNWIIHGPMYEESEGFFKWIEHWHAYEEKAQLVKRQEMQKLAPIETSLHRSRSVMQQPLMSPEGPIPPQYQQSAQFDTQWARGLVSDYSPPSAPHSGPATPDYYNQNWTYPQAPPPYSRSSWTSSGNSTYAAARSQPPSYHHTPTYPSQAYGQSMWTVHGFNCGCGLCSKQHEYYFNNNCGYGLQTVVG